MEKKALELEWENVILKEALILYGESLDELLRNFSRLLHLTASGEKNTADIQFKVQELIAEAEGLGTSNKMLVESINRV